MRQVGILCVAALVAIQENIAKLADDHKNAKILAEELNQVKGLRVDVSAVETNIIYVNIEDSKTTVEKLFKNLEQLGVRVMVEGPYRIRIVMHYRISTGDVHYTISCF